MAFGMELGWRRVSPAGAGLPVPPTEQAETTALVARMAVAPSADRRARIDALVAGLKADGLWAKLDWLCLLAAHDAQAARLNWKGAKALAAVNSPIFTVDRGYAGDGASAYLDLGETLAAGGQFAQNDASFGVWCNQQGPAAGTQIHLGSTNKTSDTRNQIAAADGSGSESYRINAATTATIGSGSGRTGHRALARLAASASRAYRDGLFVAETASTSAAPESTGTAVLLRRDASYSPDRLAAFHGGAALTDAEMAALHERLGTYLTALGAQ